MTASRHPVAVVNSLSMPGGEMSKTRVLVVEDEYILSQDLFIRLEKMGYVPLGPAATGNEAIELTENESPHVVLMDIALSGDMDGIEAAGRIGSTFNIPVIYVTAFSDDKVVDRAKTTAPYGYLIKPFIDRELKVTIETACYKHRMEEELRETREQYRALLDASGAVPWEMDTATGEFTYVGPQSSSVLGIGPDDMGNLDKWLSKVDPDDAEKVRGLYTEASRAETGSEIEYRVNLKGSRQVWIRDWITSSVSARGEIRVRGYMLDITLVKEAEMERNRYINELREALDRIRTLHGLLPICAWCKKIRDDRGYWQQVEVYIKERSDAEFTHSICPECRERVEQEMEGGN